MDKDIAGKMLDSELGFLKLIAHEYDGENILEIGTYYGKSAIAIAEAAPRSHVTTLEPDPERFEAACENVLDYNVTVLQIKSWDYLRRDHREYGMVFVDGCHYQVVRDLPWFNRLRTGGLILFHDYTPLDATMWQHPVVYDTVNAFMRGLGRNTLDLYISNTDGVGMAGFYRRESETW